METKQHNATGEDKTMKTLRDPAPETAEIYESLKIKRSGDENLGNVFVKVWRGRQSKPYAYFSFRSVERREKYIENQKRGEDARIEFAAKRKAKKQADREEARESLTVGSILHSSWGYDQTNCDFYEVIARTAGTATIQEIGSEVVPNTGGGMSCQLLPVPGKFYENSKPMKRTINGLEIKVGRNQWASKVDPKEPHYSSWYA